MKYKIRYLPPIRRLTKVKISYVHMFTLGPGITYLHINFNRRGIEVNSTGSGPSKKYPESIWFEDDKDIRVAVDLQLDHSVGTWVGEFHKSYYQAIIVSEGRFRARFHAYEKLLKKGRKA